MTTSTSDRPWETELRMPVEQWTMPADPADIFVGLSHIEDEGSLERGNKDLGQMWTAAIATGATHSSVRFLGWPDATGAVATTHIEKLTLDQVGEYAKRKADAGLSTLSLCGTVGKVYYGDDDTVLVGPATGQKTSVKWADYLETARLNFKRTRALGSMLHRGFAFYGNPEDAEKGLRRQHASWSQDRVTELVCLAAEEGVYLGLESEPNLTHGTIGEITALIDAIQHPNLLLVPDLGNMAAWGMPTLQIVVEFLNGLKHAVHMHIKDYSLFGPRPAESCGPIVEANLSHFVPCNEGCAGHLMAFAQMAKVLPELNTRARSIGLPGFFVEGEPHLKGGGQFGGFSGPDGLQTASDAVVAVLAAAGIPCRKRQFGDLLATRKLA